MIKTKGLAEIFTVTIVTYYGIAEFCGIDRVEAFNDYSEAIAYYNSIGGEQVDFIGGLHATKRIHRDKIGDHDVITQVRIDCHPITHL